MDYIKRHCCDIYCSDITCAFIGYINNNNDRGADKSLVRPGWKQPRKHVRDAPDFNKIETQAVIKFLFLQSKATKEIHAILTETLACFLPGRAKDLPAPPYVCCQLQFSTINQPRQY